MQQCRLKLLNDELEKTGKYETFRREASQPKDHSKNFN